MSKLTGRTAMIVDGHPLWLDAMTRLLEEVGVNVVARSTHPHELMELLRNHNPDVLVIGLGAGPADAELLKAIPEIRKSRPHMKIVMLAPTPDEGAIEAAFSMGVSAYCTKSAEAEDLMAAIRQSFDQSIFLGVSRRVAANGAGITETSGPAGDMSGLTKREIEILRLIAEGYSNLQAAEMLWVTEQTVKFHLSKIYKKLNVANRTEASRWAQMHGLLPVSGSTVRR